MNINLAILISGRGSNMQSIVKFIQMEQRKGRWENVKIKAVISDQQEAKGLGIARSLGVASYYLNPGEYKTKLVGTAELEYIDFLKQLGVNLICLAGFMRVLKPTFIESFKNIVNIHPSLLPDYPGLDTHRRVIDAGESQTGCTLHWVNEGVDTGETITQRRVSIVEGDTPQSLARRVIQEEYLAYQEGLSRIFDGEIELT